MDYIPNEILSCIVSHLINNEIKNLIVNRFYRKLYQNGILTNTFYKFIPWHYYNYNFNQKTLEKLQLIHNNYDYCSVCKNNIDEISWYIIFCDCLHNIRKYNLISIIPNKSYISSHTNCITNIDDKEYIHFYKYFLQ